MKISFKNLLFAATAASILTACATGDNVDPPATADIEVTELGVGQSAVNDNESQKDVVKVAVGSPDHTTLVKAVQAADLVNALSNAGPFTVFAPTNDAFAVLPAGTVESLLKPENKNQLADILQYHVTLSAFEIDRLTDGLTLGQVNGGNVKITHSDGKVMVNDATIIASVRASNGVVHVVDKVLLPQ